MIDDSRRQQRQRDKDRVRRRYSVSVDPENYEYIPAKKQIDYYDNEVHQRVAVYVRVSTDNSQQTTSFELQKKYYEDFVVRHPNWTLIRIYADEGISGTSLQHRDEFNRMIADCRAGKIDMIITKSVSRFSRNIMDCIGIVRSLAEQKPPVGVFFESECIFSLNEDSQMALSFQATMAEEESHTRSRSMEASLRMRLDNGIPLTPKLLGYTHDIDGNLVINKEEAKTVKLCFFMYLYGYTTQQIADILTEQERKTYFGNVHWTPNGIVQILRNERHCGDVLTRKTFTPNFRTHKSVRNRGERPQSRYFNHHEPIVSRDDFNAVQRLLDNAKYGNRSILPELRVIDSGLLKGFVIINPRWAAFKENEYLAAAESILEEEAVLEPKLTDADLPVIEGDFDMRGFQVARSQLFDAVSQPSVTFSDKSLKFGMDCVRKFGKQNFVELLVDPIHKRFAVRPTNKSNRNGVLFSKPEDGIYYPRPISAAAYIDTLYNIFEWNPEYKYRMIGALYENGADQVYIFEACDSEAFLKSYILGSSNYGEASSRVVPLTPSGKHIRAVPQQWAKSFGKEFYDHELGWAALANQSEEDWKLRVEGQLYDAGCRFNITGFDTLKNYIQTELSGIIPQEARNEYYV